MSDILRNALLDAKNCLLSYSDMRHASRVMSAVDRINTALKQEGASEALPEPRSGDTPIPSGGWRDAVLEEAAKVADRASEAAHVSGGNYYKAVAVEMDDIATAIRALKQPLPEPPGEQVAGVAAEEQVRAQRANPSPSSEMERLSQDAQGERGKLRELVEAIDTKCDASNWDSGDLPDGTRYKGDVFLAVSQLYEEFKELADDYRSLATQGKGES